MPPPTPRRAASAAALACLLAAGCGGPEVSLYGTITKGGKPLAVGPKGRVVVTFIHAADDNRMAAEYDPSDGSYTVPGKTDKGVLPGTYHVYVSQFDPYPGKDLLDKQFIGDGALVREVAGGRLDIDLDSPGQRAGGAGGKAGPPARLSPAARKGAEAKGVVPQKGK